MHRREGDFWNANYWFRHVGPHPVFQQLAEQLESKRGAIALSDLPVNKLTQANTVAAALVDSCERARAGNPTMVPILRQFCWLEWQFLFLHGWDN